MSDSDDTPMDDFEIADPLPEGDKALPEGLEEDNGDGSVVGDAADEGAAEPGAGEEPFTSAS